MPGLPGVSVISDELARAYGVNIDFQSPFGTQEWHTDLTHEPQPPGYTHLHLDAGPEVGGDTYVSGKVGKHGRVLGSALDAGHC